MGRIAPRHALRVFIAYRCQRLRGCGPMAQALDIGDVGVC